MGFTSSKVQAIDHFFATMDLNGDGMLTEDEFLACWGCVLCLCLSVLYSACVHFGLSFRPFGSFLFFFPSGVCSSGVCLTNQHLTNDASLCVFVNMRESVRLQMCNDKSNHVRIRYGALKDSGARARMQELKEDYSHRLKESRMPHLTSTGVVAFVSPSAYVCVCVCVFVCVYIYISQHDVV